MYSENGSKFFQYAAAMTGNLSVMALATMLGWMSPTIQKLQKKDPIAEDNPLGYAITADEGSWIGSMLSPGFICGSFFFGYVAKRWGPKTSLLLCVVPFTISWIMIGTVKSVTLLSIARFIGGGAGGAPFAVLPVYNVEISEISIRGVLSSSMQLFMDIGWLLPYYFGARISYNFLWIGCLILPIVFFVFFVFMPESPYYLIGKGRKEEAISVLAKLRGKSKDAVRGEASEIQAIIDEASKNDATYMDLFRSRSNFRALLLTCGLFSFQCLTGTIVIIYYVGPIFDDVGASHYISLENSTIIIGIVQLVASGITPLIVERVGRKALLIFSGIGETVSLIAFGLYFYLREKAVKDHGNVSSISWLPILSLMTLIAVYSVGWGPIPWTMMGEMFTPEIKSKAFSIIILDLGMSAFLVAKFFPNIVDAFGMHYGFWLLAIFCSMSVVFTIFLLPETKGKKLQEIQAELAGNL